MAEWRIALDGQPYTLREFASWYAEGAAGAWKEALLATENLVVEAHEQRRKADAISDAEHRIRAALVRSDRKPTIVIDTRRGTIEHWPPRPHVAAGDLAIADRAEVDEDEAPASVPQPQARRPQPQAPAATGATGAIVDVAEPDSDSGSGSSKHSGYKRPQTFTDSKGVTHSVRPFTFRDRWEQVCTECNKWPSECECPEIRRRPRYWQSSTNSQKHSPGRHQWWLQPQARRRQPQARHRQPHTRLDSIIEEFGIGAELELESTPSWTRARTNHGKTSSSASRPSCCSA